MSVSEYEIYTGSQVVDCVKQNVTAEGHISWEEGIQGQSIPDADHVLICCTIAREKIEIGDYEAGCDVLASWWQVGGWPNLKGLSAEASAELMLTAGALCDSVARVKRIPGGQRLAETLISGSFALFTHIGQNIRAVEARIELGCCYYHQGLFDIAHSTLRSCVESLTNDHYELRAVALIRLAIVERHSGHLHEALALLEQVSFLENIISQWTKGRFHTEMANTLKEFGVAEGHKQYFDRALGHYKQASVEFDQVGNLRYMAAVENNRGYLLLSLHRFGESQEHLERARTLFNALRDSIGCAQVDETLAQLYLADKNYDSAQRAIEQAVNTLEGSGDDVLLAEALATRGVILCRLGHRHEAKPIIERARRVAERCGDREGAGRALLILIEEMCDQLADDERREIGAQANQFSPTRSSRRRGNGSENASTPSPRPTRGTKRSANRRFTPKRWRLSANSRSASLTTSITL